MFEKVEDTAVAILEFANGARGVIQGSTACYSSDGHPAEINICGSEGSAFLADETFRVWDFKHSDSADKYVLDNHMEAPNTSAIGANDPSKINFTGHQHNFEEVVQSIQEERESSINGKEARKAVQLIDAIYQSARNNGVWISL